MKLKSYFILLKHYHIWCSFIEIFRTNYYNILTLLVIKGKVSPGLMIFYPNIIQMSYWLVSSGLMICYNLDLDSSISEQTELDHTVEQMSQTWTTTFGLPRLISYGPKFLTNNIIYSSGPIMCFISFIPFNFVITKNVRKLNNREC